MIYDYILKSPFTTFIYIFIDSFGIFIENDNYKIEDQINEFDINSLKFKHIPLIGNIFNVIHNKLLWSSDTFFVLYQSNFRIFNIEDFDSIIHKSILQFHQDFDIILFKQFQENNNIDQWLIDYNNLPKIAIISISALDKIISKNYKNIRVNYSDQQFIIDQDEFSYYLLKKKINSHLDDFIDFIKKI